MNLEARSYGDFSSEVHKRVKRGRIPVSGSLELTHRCPLACSHCYNNLPMADRAALAGELTTTEVYRILDEIAEAGCLWLLMTGGEILARADFLDIYAHAKNNGLIITLFTNGTMITPKIADYLAEYTPFAIEITLYGHTRETYERLTRVPGSFDRCRRGIALLRERGLPLALKTVAVTVNRHEVADMQRFAREEMGVDFKFDSMINARIDCSQSPLATRLRPEEVVELDMADPERRAEWTRIVSQNFRPLFADSDEVYHCGGGVSGFAIDPEGKLSICVLSHQETFDLRRGSFKEGWEQFLGKVRHKKVTRQTKCRTCTITTLCSMCPATAELESGDPEAPIDFFCQVAHLRAEMVGYAPVTHEGCEYCAPGPARDGLLQAAQGLKDGFGAPPGGAGRRPSLSLPVLASETSAKKGCGSGGCSSCASGD